MLDATSSKEAQLLRATIIVALASRMAVGTLRDGEDADQFIRRVQSVNREINYLGGDIFGPEAVGEKRCDALENAYCDSRSVFFESNLPQLEYKVVRMLIAALPQKEATKFAAQATAGNVWSAAHKFVKLGFRGADGAHRGAAAFRSSTEILAKATKQPGCDTIADPRACLGLGDEDPLTLVAKPEKLQLIDIDKNLITIYFEMIRTSCSLLPLSLESSEEESRAVRIEACNNLEFKPKKRIMTLRKGAADALDQ